VSVGKALPHESAAGHVQGTARYTDDMPRLAGMLTAWPVLAPHAHARITGLDVSSALEVPVSWTC
jgi:xanthine dehydrogenase large subunit